MPAFHPPQPPANSSQPPAAWPLASIALIRVAAFYCFTPLPDREIWQQRLSTLGESQGWKGTILLAPEGINGTIAAQPAGIQALRDLLNEDDRFQKLDWKESQVDFMPFQRFKVKLKGEVISLGDPDLDPLSQGGISVPPAEWNQLITDPDVLVLDARNDFEVKLGTFAGAVNPEIKTFRDFPAYAAQHLDPQQHPKIAMFCTGGIRCEKASALLKSQGFDQVYQLQGGILNYLATVPKTEHRWEGECFVFDDRVTVTADLQPGHYQLAGDRVIPKTLDSDQPNPDQPNPDE